MLTLNLASDSLVCRCWRLIWRRTVWFADADRCRTVYVADADAKFGVGQSMLQMLTLIFGVGQPMLQMLTLVFLTFWSTNTKKKESMLQMLTLIFKTFWSTNTKKGIATMKHLRRFRICYTVVARLACSTDSVLVVILRFPRPAVPNESGKVTIDLMTQPQTSKIV